MCSLVLRACSTGCVDDGSGDGEIMTSVFITISHMAAKNPDGRTDGT